MSDHKCDECGAERINVDAGSVCPNGHGRIYPRIEAPREPYEWGSDEDFDDDDGFYDDDDDEWDALDECGRLPPELGGGCQLAATEHCDFECPFRDKSPWADEEEE